MMRLSIRRCAVIKAAFCLVILGMPATVVAQSTESIEYFHTDAIGSVRMVTGPSGEVLERRDFLPFGEELAPPPNVQSLGFGGGARDAETENSSSLALNYFGARHLQPTSGRFTSVDPLLGAGALAEPQRWNGYSYALNNPVTYVDPDGRSPKAAIMIFKVGHALYKGYDVYSTVAGVVDAGTAIVSKDSTWGERAWGVVNLAGELSGAKDAYKGASLGFAMLKAKPLIRQTKAAAAIKLLEQNAENARKNLIRYTQMDGDPKGFDAHHVFPQVFRGRLDDILKNAGLPGLDHPMFLNWWEEMDHRSKAQAYQEEWRRVIFDVYGGSPSAEQILQEGRRIMKEFGLDVHY